MPAAAEEAEPRTRRRPPPVTEEMRQASARRRAEAAVPVVDQLPEGSAMMPPNPKSRKEALEMLRNSVTQDPNREVGVYVNTATGEHVLIQGDREQVFVDRDAKGKPVGILGEGNPQRWKELLDSDRGNWQLVAHNHPGEADASRAGYARRLPSARGGDFAVMEHESALTGGKTRHSEIHVTHEGHTSVTEFAYDPDSPRPYAVIYDDPATGQRVFRRFASLESYGEFFQNLTGISPHVDGPGSPAAKSPARTEVGPAPAGRGRSPFATGGGPGEVTPLKPTPDNPSARTDNCGFCAISHALFTETGVRPPGGAEGLHAAATARLQSRSAVPIETPPHTLYADPLPRGTTDLTAADLRASRGPVGGGEGVFGPGDWTLARQAEAAGLRVSSKEPGEVDRGADFLNPARQGQQAEHVEAVARCRAAVRGADFDNLPEPQQEAMRAAARTARARQAAASVPGNYIAYVGPKSGGNHFVNVSIDANGNWTTYDAQSGVRSTGPPPGISQLWKVSAPDISLRGSGGEGGGLPPVPGAAGRPGGGPPPVPASAAGRARTPEGPGPAAAARPGAVLEDVTARTRGQDVEDFLAEKQVERDRPAAPPAAGPAEVSTVRPAPPRPGERPEGIPASPRLIDAPEHAALAAGTRPDAGEGKAPAPLPRLADHPDPVAGFVHAQAREAELAGKVAAADADEARLAARKDATAEALKAVLDRIAAASPRNRHLADVDLDDPVQVEKVRAHVNAPARAARPGDKPTLLQQLFADFDAARARYSEEQPLARKRTDALRADLGAVRDDIATLQHRLATEVRPYNDVPLSPQLPPPVAGWDYKPVQLEGGTAANELSHLHGFQAELRLANDIVVNRGELVVSYGDKIGRHGADVVSVHPETGEVTLWDSKYHGSGMVEEQSPTFSGRRLQNAIDEAIADLRRATHLPASVRDLAIRNLEKGNFKVATVSSRAPPRTNAFPITGEEHGEFHGGQAVGGRQDVTEQELE
ncbi:MAG: hypothetical protein FIA97_15795 [Methylococcaceae bacterium]|nr:hypothetical protein [Methylococcaceae bacterium]